MKWFRFFNEALDDPKVQKLSGDDFKFWINILCLASRNNGILPSINDISFSLRVTENETQEKINCLINLGLIDKKEKGLTPHGWKKRQYKSDTSTERVKRFRNGKKHVSETANETPPDTEAEAERVYIKPSSPLPPSLPAKPEAGDYAGKLKYVLDLLGKKNDLSLKGNDRVLFYRWLEIYDLDLDIIPTILRISAAYGQKNNSRYPISLKYYDNALRESYGARNSHSTSDGILKSIAGAMKP